MSPLKVAVLMVPNVKKLTGCEYFFKALYGDWNVGIINLYHVKLSKRLLLTYISMVTKHANSHSGMETTRIYFYLLFAPWMLLFGPFTD